MKRLGHFAFFVLSLSSLLAFSSVPQTSFGQLQDLTCPSCVSIPPEEIDLYESLFPLIIRTDSESYDHDSLIVLQGHLRPENLFFPVTITVTNPIGNIVTIEQITPDENGDFSVTFNTASTLWSQDGNYIIKAQSGEEPRIFKTQVQIFSSGLDSVTQCEIHEIAVQADNGGKYCIPYWVNGKSAEFSGILNIDSKTLSIFVSEIGVNSLELKIPRALIDSKSTEGTDSDFIVMFDGNPIGQEELEASPMSRVILIHFPTDQSGRIDIIGTSVIPEFGTIVITIFAISITSILIMMKKTNLSLQNFKV